MQTTLTIYGINIAIDSNEEIAFWLLHDYGFYASTPKEKTALNFKLICADYDKNKLPELEATTYHDDYIVYDDKNTRIIDFIEGGVSIYNIIKKEIEIYCANKDILYEIFHLSFECLLGDELDKAGYHRIHCLALEKSNLATILLLPPGAGKTTLALKFSRTEKIRVLAEDILLLKNKNLTGLHFRWGVRDTASNEEGRIIKRKKYDDKLLLDANKFNLAHKASFNSLILGKRISSSTSQIFPVSKFKLFLPLFKSMVLGLELQQSVAYFLLRNHKDFFLKSKIGINRLRAFTALLVYSKTFIFLMGTNIDKNYKTLSDFVLHDTNI